MKITKKTIGKTYKFIILQHYNIVAMSFEELWGLDHGSDISIGNKEEKEQISSAMREAVAEQSRQWKIISWKIAASKAQHHIYAEFLAFLLWKIKSDELISLLYRLFFTTKDPFHGTIHIRKSSNYPVLIGMFVPFFRDKVIEYKMQPLYSPLYDPNQNITAQSYLIYLKKLAHAMHDNVALDQQLLLQCIMQIFQEYSLVNINSLEENDLEEIKSLIKRELY